MRMLFLLLAVCMVLISSPASSDTLGPIRSADGFLSSALNAKPNDTFLFTGDIDCSNLSLSGLNLVLTSAGGRTATLRNLSLSDSSVRFERIRIEDSFSISGHSEIELQGSVSVSGKEDSCGLSFQGNGMLIIDSGCTVFGGSGAPGIQILHTEGDFYANIEGAVRGGDGDTGGTALVISSLCEQGTVFVNAELKGGNGAFIGGNALSLYQLTDAAYVSVEGNIQGGNGKIGGDGFQVVSAKDRSFVRFGGTSSGGMGESHGGNALTILRVSGSSTVIVDGKLAGGDVFKRDGIGGHSLLIADNASIGHTVIRNSMLQDGGFVPKDMIPRHPSITSSVRLAHPLNETPLPPDLSRQPLQ